MFSRFIIFYYLYVKLCWILLDIYGKNRTNFYYILHKKEFMTKMLVSIKSVLR